MKICGPVGFVLTTVVVLIVGGSAGDWTSNPRAQEAGAAVPSTARRLRVPDVPYRYADPDFPIHFRQQAASRFDNTPPDNPVTDDGAALGRVLFYDTRLSASNTISCGSCHVQAHGFADPNRFSRGHQGGRTDRHAMNLVNLRFHPRGRFFWDERGGSLEAMVLMPVENHLEMGEDPAHLPEKLRRDEDYALLFQRAFGDPAITTDRISRALAQFLRSMVSYQSRYDVGRARAKSVAEDF